MPYQVTTCPCCFILYLPFPNPKRLCLLRLVAFSNTSGGWIVFGVHQHGKKFDVVGCDDPEKIESDFLNTLRNGQKFNVKLTAWGKKYNIEGKIV